jgi:hypothetical protein
MNAIGFWAEKSTCLIFVSGGWFNSYNGEICGFFSHMPKTIDFGLL